MLICFIQAILFNGVWIILKKKLFLLTILSSLTGEEISSIESRYVGLGYGAFKKEVADVVLKELETFECLAFLSNGIKIEKPKKLKLEPYFKQRKEENNEEN